MTRKNEGMVGQRFNNSYGETAEIISYKSNKDVLVKFSDSGYRCSKGLSHLKSGKFSSPYSKTVYGIGYIGEGSFNKANARLIMARWAAMLGRCHDQEVSEQNPSYKDCSVVDEWHNFQNYAHWYSTHEFRNDSWEVDKDFMSRDEKVYSPTSCTFVPQEVNSFLCNAKAVRGAYPIGVYYSKTNSAFIAMCKQGSKNKYLGGYSNPEDAFLAYKAAKEAYGRVLADRYHGKVHPAVIERLKAFTVNIDD